MFRKKKSVSSSQKTKASSSFNEYAKKLKSFYQDLKYFQFMSNKKEIARQDVMLTPEGPVELYRRDVNGRERVLPSPIRSELSHKYSKSTRSIGFDNDSVVIDEISPIYNRHHNHNHRVYDIDDYDYYDDAYSDLCRDREGKYGLPFDWYDSRARRSEILHEEVQVLSNRPSRHYETYSPINVYRSNSYVYGEPRKYSSSRYYDDHKRYNDKDYDVYEYYEYDDEEDDYDDPRDHHRHVTRSRHALESPIPIPPTRHRKNRKPISYIDYDNVSDSSNNSASRRKNERQNNSDRRPNENLQSPLSSSVSGKELWKRTNSSSRLETNKNSSTNVRNNPNNRNIQNQNQNAFNMYKSGRSPQTVQNNIVNKNNDNKTNRSQQDIVNTTANNNVTNLRNVNLPPTSSDPKYNDLPGNDVVRTNPLFNIRDPNFMY